MSAWTAMGTQAAGARLKAMQNSPNWNGGKFINPLPNREPKFFETLGKWLGKSNDAAPKAPIPVVMRAAADFQGAPASGLRITWLGHSSFLLEIDGSRLLIDPMWSQRSSPFTWGWAPSAFTRLPCP
ncbi:MAG: MBL fold metallo-hydrolase [Desulfarculaceae bacterium]|nr:MBL fold metallo-hydrolase [Desulfarculaceae bacterium]MCF8072747.1 MBL fold metallo-hydrolase [Desulfarculaceae bacterium]MCF8100915.1 MBL fold metallo-hydrolase [Desulfarculaceae bacterium]MCF8118563.1 MBL fold metallo-hydrolase [Desulfarculaceae bacterium]